jgi:hypothetical protein
VQSDTARQVRRIYGYVSYDIKRGHTAYVDSLMLMRTHLNKNNYGYINAQRLGLNYDINEKIYRLLPSLQLKDIVDFEQQNMGHKPYRYVILSDEKELDIKALEQIAPVRRLSLEEIFGY